jgi:hypothetical protein
VRKLAPNSSAAAFASEFTLVFLRADQEFLNRGKRVARTRMLQAAGICFIGFS